MKQPNLQDLGQYITKSALISLEIETYWIMIENAKAAEQARIIKLLEAERDAANEQTVIRNVLNGVIALIKGDVTERLQTGMSPNGYTKGENKPKHTPCCDDWDCYGCEDCDCPDCLKEENK